MENKEIIEKVKLVMETKDYNELKEVSSELDIEFQRSDLKAYLASEPNIFLTIHRMSDTIIDERGVANIQYILATQESVKKIKERNRELFISIIEMLGGEFDQEAEEKEEDTEADEGSNEDPEPEKSEEFQKENEE